MDEKTVNINKRKIYVTLLIVVICLIGVTYAFFTLYLRQSEENTITSLSCFSTTFTEETNAISLEKTYAVTEDEGMSYSPFTFKIKNNCTDTIYAYITIDSLNEGTSTNLDSSHVRYNLSTKGTTDGISKILKPSSTKKLENGHNGYVIKTLALGSNEELEYDLRLWVDEKTTASEGLSKTWSGQVVIVSDAATPNSSWDLPGEGTLLAAIKRDNTVTEPLTVPGTEPSAHTLDDVQIQTASVSSTYQAYYITYGTGWEANGTKFNLMGTAVTSNTYANSYSTLVGKYLTSSSLSTAGSSTAGTMKTTTNLSAVYYVISATSDSFTYKTLTSNKNAIESVLAGTEDDYGTSYYFRGAVTNNFVEYANMCWRIVRITGNGAIKLVLYNYNGLTSTNNIPSSNTPCNVTGNDYALARYEGDTYKSTFNSNYKDNAYVGLMYGTAGASSYADAHANTKASTILTNLNKWYTNVLSKQANFSDNQLSDTIWCNDKSVVTDATFNPGNWTLGTNYGYAKNLDYYSATKRLVQASSWTAGGTGPSLICPNDNNGGKLSKFTVSDTEYGNGTLSGYAKVGLLTADEIAFAGGASGTSNSTYYIKGNTNSSMWWALSPRDFDGPSAIVWYVSGGHSSLGGGIVSYRNGVRPSLSLQLGVKISSGVGSATSPYKVVME